MFRSHRTAGASYCDGRHAAQLTPAAAGESVHHWTCISSHTSLPCADLTAAELNSESCILPILQVDLPIEPTIVLLDIGFTGTDPNHGAPLCRLDTSY